MNALVFSLLIDIRFSMVSIRDRLMCDTPGFCSPENSRSRAVLRMISRLVIPLFLLIGSLPITAAPYGSGAQEDPNASLFSAYLRKNWDDLHDVIMRFHKDDPYLAGSVLIQMQWNDGRLDSAKAEENTTNNIPFADALIEAMRRWYIKDMVGSWTAALPVRTEIVGSNHPDFQICGILTGNLKDAQGLPVQNAKLLLAPKEDPDLDSLVFTTNREGIFIKTLIPAGQWILFVTNTGRSPVLLDTIALGGGEHVKRTFRLK